MASLIIQDISNRTMPDAASGSRPRAPQKSRMTAATRAQEIPTNAAETRASDDRPEDEARH